MKGSVEVKGRRRGYRRDEQIVLLREFSSFILSVFPAVTLSTASTISPPAGSRVCVCIYVCVFHVQLSVLQNSASRVSAPTLILMSGQKEQKNLLSLVFGVTFESWRNSLELFLLTCCSQSIKQRLNQTNKVKTTERLYLPQVSEA